MANPYTRFGYGATTDEDGEQVQAPERTYGTKSTGKTKRRNPYTSYGYTQADEEEKATTRVNKLLDQGWSFEDIARDTGSNLEAIRSYAEASRPGYGMKEAGPSNIEKIGGVLKNVGYEVVGRPLSNFSQGISSALTAGGEQDIIAEGQKGELEAFNSYTKQFREGKISEERYKALLKTINRDYLQEQNQQIMEESAPGRFAASGAELGVMAAGGGLAKLGAKTGIAGKAALGATEGAALGGVAELQNKDRTARSLLTSMGIGAVAGGGLAAGIGKVLNDVGAAKQLIRNTQTTRILNTIDNLPGAVEPVTDASRLLTSTTATARNQVASRVDEITAQLEDLRLGRTQNPSGKGARELIKERQGLRQHLAKIDSGDGVLKEVSEINDEIAKAMDSGADNVGELLTERQTILQSAKDTSPTARQNAEFIEQNANTQLSNKIANDPTNPLPAPGNKTPRASQRLSDSSGVGTSATYATLSDDAQEVAYQTLKANNPDVLKQIARGEVDGRQFGLTNEYVVSKAADDSIKNMDVQGVRDIADGKVLTEASLKGQEISSLRHLQTDSPIKSIKDIQKARADVRANYGKGVSLKLTDMEVEQILRKANTRDSLKEKYLEEIATGKVSQKTRLEYGKSVVDYRKYVEGLKPGASISSVIKNPGKAVLDLAGTTKSLRASLDLSATLRQGIKLLGTGKYKTWAEATAKSVRAAVKELGGENAMDWHMADIYSRENFLNGNYKRMGVAVADVVEEAFPSKALGKVPLFRRLYSASDSAYTVFSQQARADLADSMIDKATKAGVDVAKEGKQIGAMVNALTGRGSLGKYEGSAANALNNVFFSPRLLKSNFDVLGGHVLSGGAGGKFLTDGSSFVRKEASKNLLKMAVTAYAVYKTAESIRPNSVEWDPRSSNFGKIKVGNTRFDVTGGMGSLITLGGRIVKGSTKSSTTDNISKLNDEEDFFSRTYADLIGNFAENKLSPAVSALVDVMKGEDFSGKKPTVGSTIKNLTVPIIVDNYQELSKDKNAAPLVASLILEGLGIGTNTYDSTDDWSVKPNKTEKQFKQVVGDTKFKLANDIYNQRFTDWFREIRYTDQYKKLSPDGRTKLLNDNRASLKEQVMKEFDFKYTREERLGDPEQGTIDALSRFTQ